MAQGKRLDFGVENPITIANPGDYDWNVWRREAQGDIWEGFFRDAQTALDWVKTQPHGNFVVNNVPPATSRRYITGGARPKPFQQPSRSRTAMGIPTRVDRTPVREVKRAAAKAAAPVETAESRRLKQAAAKRLAKHERDEAADIAAGRTEG